MEKSSNKKKRLMKRKGPLAGTITRTTAHLREKRPLILGLLDAVGHQPFHGFGAVLVELTEVGGQVAPPHHVDDLKGGTDGGETLRYGSIATQKVTCVDSSACRLAQG